MEQPEFKHLKVSSENSEINQGDLFQYKARSMSSLGEQGVDIQLLYQSKCARRVYLFDFVQPIQEQLKNSYVKEKLRVSEQNRMELLVHVEIASFWNDLHDADMSMINYQQALTIQQRYFSDDLLTTASLLLKITILLLIDEKKNNNQIIANLRQIYDNYRIVLGIYSPKLVSILILLGDENCLKGNIIEGLHYYQECMLIANSLGYSGPNGIKLLDKLGWAFFQTSEYHSSLKFFLRSIQMKEKIFMEKDISLAETYNNLGECFRVLNDQVKAIYTFESSLNIIIDLIQQTYQQDSLKEGKEKDANKFKLLENQRQIEKYQGSLIELKAQVYNNLGIMYKSMNKYEKATILLKEAYQIRGEIFGQTSQQALECLYNMAVIYDDQQKHTQAMQLYDQVIQQFKVSKDQENIVYADCLQNKAISYFNIHDFTKALNLLNESMAIKRKKIGFSVSLAVTLQNLALVYHKQGQYKKALQLYDEALKICIKKLKPDHPFISAIQENIKMTQRFTK